MKCTRQLAKTVFAPVKVLSAGCRKAKLIFNVLASPSQRRYACRWLCSWRRSYLLEMPLPWLTFDAIEFLTPRLRQGMRVFEYGSGGSSLFWLSHGASCVSIEHDSDWYAFLRQKLISQQPIEYRLVLPELEKESGCQRDPADPEGYSSADEAFQGYSFRKYVEQIDAFPDEYFDLVLVDGRARPACIKHCVSKIKQGGLLVLDNADRSYYLSHTQAYLRDFQLQEFIGLGPGPGMQEMWKTNIYTRSIIKFHYCPV